MDYRSLRWRLGLLRDMEEVSQRDILRTLITTLAMTLAFLGVTALIHSWGHCITLGAFLASFAIMALAIFSPDERGKRELPGLEGWLISTEKQSMSWFFLGLALLILFFVYGMLAAAFMWPI